VSIEAAPHDRSGAVAGFLSLVIGAAAVAFERGAVGRDASAQEMSDFLAANGSAQRAQALLFVLGSGALIWFLGALRTFLARAEGGSGNLANVAFAAGVGSTILTLTALCFQAGLTLGSGREALPALFAVMTALFNVANLPLAVMLLAVAVVTIRTRALPAWLAWLSLAAAATQVVPLFGLVAQSGPLAFDGALSVYLPYPLYVAWLGCTSFVLFRRAGHPVRKPDAGD
jgi:hypothetical protein